MKNKENHLKKCFADLPNSFSQNIIWGIVLFPQDMPKWAVILPIIGIILSFMVLIFTQKKIILTNISNCCILLFLAWNLVVASHPMARLGSLIIFSMLLIFFFFDLTKQGTIKLSKNHK